MACDFFRELINVCVIALISSVEAKTEKCYAEMFKVNWQSFATVKDTSPYVKQISESIQQKVAPVKRFLNSVYFQYFLNKLCQSVINQFL